MISIIIDIWLNTTISDIPTYKERINDKRKDLNILE